MAHVIEESLWTEQNYLENKLSAHSFAKMFGCSKRMIDNVVREYFKMGFVSFRRIIRLLRAQRDLNNQAHRNRIADIALSYGFEHSRFTTYYKRTFGVYPRDGKKYEIMQSWCHLASDTAFCDGAGWSASSEACSAFALSSRLNGPRLRNAAHKTPCRNQKIC